MLRRSISFFHFFYFIAFLAFLSGCSANKDCSTDSQCKEGSFCGDNGSCTEFNADDYNVVFENLTDGQLITTADDNDKSKDGIQIDIPVKFEDSGKVVKDGMSVMLIVTGKSTVPVVYSGSVIKDKAVFSLVTIPVGEVNIKSHLTMNPSKAADVTINAKNIGIDLYYLKNGAGGTKTILENSTINDADDFDKQTSNGIQLSISASSDGLTKGDTIKIFIPELQEAVVAEAVVDENGDADFNSISIPIMANIRMTVVSGEYSRNIDFSVTSQFHCGFIVNLENDMLFGSPDDKNTNLGGLQFDLIIGEITGCGQGSKISIYIDKQPGEGVVPDNSFYTASSTVQERITLQKSQNPNDKRSVFIVIEDEEKDISGSASFTGMVIDLDPPLVEIVFPEVGQVLNMEDDIDDQTAGLQVKFSGEATDALTSPVSITLKLIDTIISEQADINGDFEFTQSFSQSYPASVIYAVAIDSAGNSSQTSVPFSVSIDSDLQFYSVCGKTDTDIMDGMWLNGSDDSNNELEELQCKIILRVEEGTGVTDISLKAGDDEAVKKPIGIDNMVEFDLDLPESFAGISLNASAFVEDVPLGQNNLTVRVDTVLPAVTLSNNLLLNNGETTSAIDLTVNFQCSDISCNYNSLLDDEVTTLYTADASRTVTGLASGEHTMKVRARDAAGNIGDQTTFTWFVDSEAPETTITSDPGAGSVNDFALFAFTSSKINSSFECKLEKDGTPLVPGDGSWESCNGGSRDYYGLADGSYRFLVRAEDTYGNVDPSPAEHLWIIGSAAPVTTITGTVPADPNTNITSMDITFEATVDSTFECRLEKDGAEVEPWADCSSGTVAYASLTDGGYLFSVRATAIYGTEELNPASYTWVVDTNLPKIIILSKPGKLTPYDAGTVLFECVGEAEACVFTCEFDSSPVDCELGYYSFAGISEGTHNFKVSATDKAGNVSSVVSSDIDTYQNDYSWTVNTSALGVLITSKPATATISTAASFSFESNKAASFECKIDGEDYAPCTSPESYTGLAQGSHTFTVKATFAEEIAFASYIWTVDSSSPVVTITSGPANPTNKTSAVIHFSANETVSFECKLATDAEWTACTSPKIYASGTFGVGGTYTFNVRAKDQAGNTGTASYSWIVDLQPPVIEWISPAIGTDGKIKVGKAQDVYPSDPGLYAINVVVRVTGSNIGQPINVKGFKTPPGYNIISVDSAAAKNYTLVIGLQDGARVNNPLTISVSDGAGSTASMSKVVIVNTDMPTITWASPANNHKFVSTTTAPSFVFNVWNALPGTTVELVDFDTSNIVGTAVTVGASGIQEYVTINPVLADRCAPYKLYATFLDTGENVRYYTNSTSDTTLKTSRTFTVDRTVPAIGNIAIAGVDETDRILNRADNLNTNPDGGLKTDITVNISDSGNGSDSNRTVRIFTNNGIGSDASFLLSSLNDQGSIAAFQEIALGESNHILKIEVTDCSGNVVSQILPSVTVDTIIPELTVSSPRGSASNWRWLTFADDPAIGTIAGGNFTEIEMIINSSEDLGSFVEAVHTSYDYSDTQNYQNDISTSAIVGTDSVTIALPDLEYAKHRFVVTVQDLAGNSATAGNESIDLYEVDVIVPQIAFNDINDGDSFDTDMDPVTPGFQIIVKLDMTDVEPLSTHTLRAVPVLSQGGSIDGTRIEKEWTDTVSVDGTINKNIQLGNGWWRLSSIIKDNHDNQSSTGEIDINFVVADPSITLKKSYNYAIGTGPVIQGSTVESSAWMIPGDVVCTDDDCDTEIEVWTDAPAGSTAYVSINGGVEVSKTTVSNSGQSYANFNVTLDNSLSYNSVEVRVVSTTLAEGEAVNYIKIDETLPTLTLINPAACTGICRRMDIADDPGTTDLIELAELGYGYSDDAAAGGVLNFKTAGAIQFMTEEAEGGTVTIESIAGITNGTASISYDSIGGYYYADFTTLTVADSITGGQTDYDLVFKVTETPSGAVSRYLVKLHVNLEKPTAIDISGGVDISDKEGKVNIEWNSIGGNNSTYGENPGAVYRYDVRYQDYNTGSCTIGASFTSAKEPLGTIAGPVPTPVIAGEMSYEFFVNRINNGKATSDPLYREFDTHKNGNKYCFAVAAVDAVYAEDGTVLAENLGNISPNDTGEMKMDWTSIRADNPQEHFAVLRNLGDLDGDGLDDFVIADGYKSSDGSVDDYAGNVWIYFTKGEATFEKTGVPDESLGQGVSSKADFNGDGFLDFAYTNVDGEVFVHFGSETGLNAFAGVNFTAKDDNYDVFRTMATGDYNGDGCDDIAISAPTRNGAGTARGQVYIYYGRGSNCSSSTPISGTTPDITFEGSTNNDQLGKGEIYSVGDINGDGKTDFAFPTDTKVFIAYGGDSGGVVPAYNLTGMKSLVGLRIGYGNFNGDAYSDLVVANNDRIYIYHGGAAGVVSTPSMTINDIGIVNYTYPPAITNFAKTVACEMVDINGDGLTDLITASDRGLLVYETHLGTLSTMPSIFDPFINSASAFTKVLMLDYGIVYCNNESNKGSCYTLNYGE